jgi:signal transduction histidine kinase
LLERSVRRANERGSVELVYAASHTWIRGREADLEIAIGNLLDNAQRYGPSDKPVRVAARDRAAGVEVSVADEGPGVPAGRREKIWERFYTTHAADGGTGLGLAIVDSVARAHGGRVALETSAGGSEFSIWIPFPNEKRSAPS